MLKFLPMKKYILLLVVLVLVMGCNNDDYNSNNKYLADYNFQVNVNMSQPLYGQLRFPANPVRVNEVGAGINGIIVTNTGSGFAAFEASCPNQYISDCSSLIINGIMAICPCDDVEYNLMTGDTAADVQYPLKRYKVQQISEDVLVISN